MEVSELTEALQLMFEPTDNIKGFFTELQIREAFMLLIEVAEEVYYDPIKKLSNALNQNGGNFKTTPQFSRISENLSINILIDKWRALNAMPTQFKLEEFYKSLRSVFNKKILPSEKIAQALELIYPGIVSQIINEDTNTSCNQFFTELLIRSHKSV